MLRPDSNTNAFPGPSTADTRNNSNSNSNSGSNDDESYQSDPAGATSWEAASLDSVSGPRGEEEARRHHSGIANPLGPIPKGGKTTRTQQVEDVSDDKKGSRQTLTSVWTTILPDGHAFRTTRVLGVRRSLKQGGVPPAPKPLVTTFERSEPLGTTHRIIRHHRSDGSFTQTTEEIRPGGSTTVKHASFDTSGRMIGGEEVADYPPMEITSKVGWDGRPSPSAVSPYGQLSNYMGLPGGGEQGRQTDAPTVVSELTNPRISRPFDLDEDHTMAGNSTRYDDPTLDPTTIDYNAGYNEEMARKFGENNPDAKSGQKGTGRRSPRTGNNTNWSVAESLDDDDLPRTPLKGGWAKVGGGMDGKLTSKSKLIAFAVCTVILAIAVGAGAGAVAGRKPPSPSPTPTPTPEEALDEAGYGRYWPSEDGWVVAPSYASFDSALVSASSYYTLYNGVTNIGACAGRCNRDGAVGGAYFEKFYFPSSGERPACMCYRAAECYDPKLKWSGGTVFLREDQYLPENQMCLMSTCGYFPVDPICDELDLVSVEALMDVEIRHVPGPMSSSEIRLFEQSCADVLNDAFGLSGLPVEGIRCQVDGQEESVRQRRSMQQNRAKETPLSLSLITTGLFIATAAFPDEESVAFGSIAQTTLDEVGDKLVQDIKKNAEFINTDYFVGLIEIETVGEVESPSPTPPVPTAAPTFRPTRAPVSWPTTELPTTRPTRMPTRRPTAVPTAKPTSMPTSRPTKRPGTNSPTSFPTTNPSETEFCRIVMSGGTRVPKRVCWVQIGETIESEEEEDGFGTVVNFDKTGSRFIVSAPLSSDDSGRMTLTGMVKVYEAMPTGVKSSVGIEGIEFVQVGQTLYGEYSGNRIVGFLSANGESLVVAAPSRNENNGSVFVYSRENGEEWELVGEPIDGKVAGERFGHSVTISNDGRLLVVGAPFNNGGKGATRVYQWSGNQWRQIGRDIVGTRAGGRFGWSVALASNNLTFAVGQKTNDSGKEQGPPGEVRVFRWKANPSGEGIYEQLGDPLVGERPGDDFGSTLDISASGLIVAIGAKYADGSADRKNAGQVKTFEFNFNNKRWFKTPFGPTDLVGLNKNDEMTNLSMSGGGGRVAVGSNKNRRGYLAVFDNNGVEGWRQTGGRIDGPIHGEEFGPSFSLSQDGKRLVVGYTSKDGESDRGAVKAFQLFGE